MHVYLMTSVLLRLPVIMQLKPASNLFQSWNLKTMAGLVLVWRNERLLKRYLNEMELSFLSIPYWDVTLVLEDSLWIALFLEQHRV